MVDMLLGTINRGHSIQVESILDARFPLDEESLAVSTPERSSEILVIILVEICPCGAALLDVHYTYTDLRVGISAFRVAGHPDRTSGGRHILKIHGTSCILAISKLET